MLDMMTSSSSGHGTTGAAFTPTGTPTNKRIPASLMKMRRESLAAAGKYKLPTMQAGVLPENSLASMAAQNAKATSSPAAMVGSVASSLSNTVASASTYSSTVATSLSNTVSSTLSSTVSALVTPKRLTPKSLRITLDRAACHMNKPDIDCFLDLDEGADQEESKPQNNRLRRSLSTANVDSTSTSLEMDALLRSGLATPRRTSSRPSIAVKPTADTLMTGSSHHSKRVAKLRSKSQNEGMSGSHHTAQSQNGGSAIEQRRRRISRRSKSVDETNNAVVNALATPRRASRKPTVGGPLRRSNSSASATLASHRMDILATPARNKSARSLVLTNKPAELDVASVASSASSLGNDDDSFANSSMGTKSRGPQGAAKTWKCTCGEENDGECRFCGMCGSRQRWECADCQYANKCKFKFCGMCGIAKKIVAASPSA